MATFASLTSNNIVKRLIKINDSFGADESQELLNAITNLVPFIEDEIKWKQTYYSGALRKRLAFVKGIYDETNDVFLREKPFASWILDSEYEWVPPQGRWPHNPTDATSKNISLIQWSEEAQKFYGFAPIENDNIQLKRYIFNFVTDIWDFEKEVPQTDPLQN
jgi:hypothetical protein